MSCKDWELESYFSRYDSPLRPFILILYHRSRSTNLLEKFPTGQMKRFVRPAKPVAKEHLLPVLPGPESFNQVDVVVHIPLGGFNVNHVADVVRFLVEAQFDPFASIKIQQ